MFYKLIREQVEFFNENGYLSIPSIYALTLVLKEPDNKLCRRVMKTLTGKGVEFRRGTAGGGNQLRQPYLKSVMGEEDITLYPNVDHIHFYGFYIGNYPELEREKILKLCGILNRL